VAKKSVHHTPRLTNVAALNWYWSVVEAMYACAARHVMLA